MSKTITMCKRDYERKLDMAKADSFTYGVGCGIGMSALVAVLIHMIY